MISAGTKSRSNKAPPASSSSQDDDWEDGGDKHAPFIDDNRHAGRTVL